MTEERLEKLYWELDELESKGQSSQVGAGAFECV